MSKVSIIKCTNYEYNEVKLAIKESLDSLGGISAFTNPGDKILLKVNILMKRKLEKVTTTHPVIAQVLAELVTKLEVSLLLVTAQVDTTFIIKQP